MKKLFTFCASALLALTLSAQAEQPQGTFYLGVGDATELVNIFGNGSITIAPVLGYAVKDNIVVQAMMTNTGVVALNDSTDVTTGVSAFNTGEEAVNIWTLGATYFLDNGIALGLQCTDVAENFLEERRYSASVGKMIMLGAISDSVYLLPTINIDSDSNWESNISFGFRF